MSNPTILVIDDSSTIRRLVDQTLSRDGYVVVLAENAELGIQLAGEVRPDLILLDHQLPGTTGFNVCQQLIASPHLSRIPVVISSTLRKKAYVEYSDLPNVVDMLPKPYSEDLLMTTVANALDTGKLVVDSQSQGTAVPEVIDTLADSDLTGLLSKFSAREVLDFLNNGRKNGTLQIESAQNRFWIHLDQGRIQGVSATGIPAHDIISRLPESLAELAPVLRVTLSRGGNQLDGIVDLLNTNVLDPRLLRKLLRHQAAVLMHSCFTQPLKAFRFDGQKAAPPLFQRLPLDISSLALLIEGAMTCEDCSLPEIDQLAFMRKAIRGQNLDRAGLAAHHARILPQLTSPHTVDELASILEWKATEVRRVLYGLQLAELVETQQIPKGFSIIALEHDLTLAEQIKWAYERSDNYDLKLVSDATAFSLLLRRTSADVIIVDGTCPDSTVLGQSLRELRPKSKAAWLLAVDPGFSGSIEGTVFDAILTRPYDPSDIANIVTKLSNSGPTLNADRVESQEMPQCAT